MTKFIPILIMDEDDTPRHNSMTLKEFLEIIEEHRKNTGIDPEDIFVKIKTEEYEEDKVSMEMGTIEFLVKK